MSLPHVINSVRSSSIQSSRVGPIYASASADINESNIEDDKPEVNEPTTSEGGIKFGLYSWFVLSIILGIRILYQWQRSIFSYCYGYKGLGD